jgi:hypothetical protein
MAIKVKDEYRKNELSFIPGGSEVTAILRDGTRLTYDKIKSVTKYCDRLKEDRLVIELHVNGEVYWNRNQ